MNKEFYENLPRIIDISCVRANHTMNEIDEMIETAKKHKFLCVFTLPSFTKYTADMLRNEPDIITGGTVGFPSGCDTTTSKVFQAGELLSLGADELDMVINLTEMKSHNYKYVYDDIKAVVNAAGKAKVKAIIEAAYLTDDEIRSASEIAVSAGAAYVKTGTGWAPFPTTLEHIKIIKETVGDSCRIKAAGGIRDLDTLIKMAEAGCQRFGIGVTSAVKILKEADKF